MQKNEILKSIIDDLMRQRSTLTTELRDINHNESNSNEKRMTLENAISSIDMQLDRRVVDCELNQENQKS